MDLSSLLRAIVCIIVYNYPVTPLSQQMKDTDLNNPNKQNPAFWFPSC